MDDKDKIFFQGMNPEYLNSIAHMFGHKIMEAKFQYHWNVIGNEIEHEFLPKNHPHIIKVDISLVTAIMYMTGFAAEEIYNDANKSFENSKKTIDRKISDMKYAYPHIIIDLKNKNKPCDYSSFDKLPQEIYSGYINQAKVNLGLMADKYGITTKELIEKGVLNTLFYIGNNNN